MRQQWSVKTQRQHQAGGNATGLSALCDITASRQEISQSINRCLKTKLNTCILCNMGHYRGLKLDQCGAKSEPVAHLTENHNKHQLLSNVSGATNKQQTLP